MEKSKIKSVEPLMLRGQHQTWEKEGTIYYKFMVTMEDGTMGTAMSKSQTPYWKVGETVSFTFNNGYISGIKKADEKKSGGYYEDPRVQDNITRNLCLRTSIGFLSKFEDQESLRKGDFFKLAEKFYQWCYQDFTDNQHLLNRRSALERAIESMEIKPEAVVNSNAVIHQADEILQWVSQESLSH